MSGLHQRLVARYRPYIRDHPEAKATIDFETRSALSLLKHGSWLYSKHPTTEAMCLAYSLPVDFRFDDEPDLWHRAHPEYDIAESPDPVYLFAWIEAGGAVEAHNAFFERVIWRNIMVSRYGWPEMPHKQWRCSAAKASACSLPRSLEGAVLAMGLSIEKDMDGRRLMLKMCKPRKPLKQETLDWMEENNFTGKLSAAKLLMPMLWHESEPDVRRQWLYCQQDVRAEEALSEVVPDLSAPELKLWQIDQKMNERGAQFDIELARAALAMANEAKRRLNLELKEMTGIEKGTMREQVKTWLVENEDLELPDTAAPTLVFYLENEEISGRARRVIDIVKEVNRTSTRKFQAVIDRTDSDDGRARDLLLYHGAGTGRWSGKGIQVHNFPRGNIKDMDEACEDILSGDFDWVYAMHGDVMEFLSGATRGTVIAAPGRDIIVADYSAIEARCVLWLAGAEQALDVFRRGGDIYCDMATGIYGFEVNKKDFPKERRFGKQAILGLGYGMGFITFLLTCRKYDIHFSVEQVKGILGDTFEKYYEWVSNYLFPKPTGDAKKDANKRRQASKTRRQLLDARQDPKAIIHELALMKYTVDIYRTRYSEVKRLWADQEGAAMRAVREWEAMLPTDDIFCDPEQAREEIEGPVIAEGRVRWYVRQNFLCCELPSGRLMRYRAPHIKPTRTAWGALKEGLRYMSVYMGKKWVRTGTYGGKVVENITQAVARDIMADAVINTEDDETPYDVFISVHDELVAEVDNDKGSLKEFEEVMSRTSPWANGCPITAEAERYNRYRK